MGSEAEVVSLCSAHQVRDPDCRRCNVRIPQAEVVREGGWTVKVDGLSVAQFKYHDHARRWAHENYPGRHQPIPSESPATKRGEEVPTPPHDKPKPEAKCDGKGDGTMPTCNGQASAYMSPCDGKGRIAKPVGFVSFLDGRQHAVVEPCLGCYKCRPCPGCPACKPKPDEVDVFSKFDQSIASMSPETVRCLPTHDPEAVPHPQPKPDDAEEVARKIVYDWNQTDHNAYSEGLLTDNELAALEARITAAIRADRQKHADLAGKVRELCHRVSETTTSHKQMELAREVLAMMEAK